jgi:hypothetical protein
MNLQSLDLHVLEMRLFVSHALLGSIDKEDTRSAFRDALASRTDALPEKFDDQIQGKNCMEIVSLYFFYFF